MSTMLKGRNVAKVVGRILKGAEPIFICSVRGDEYREDQFIVVAGWGTSQAVKHALRWPAAHAEQLKKQHGLKNLQAPAR